MSEGSDQAVTTTTGRVLELFGSVVAPSTVVTAFLYFFGWVRTGAFYHYFGLDGSVLRLSTQDYLLRSPELALRPLVLMLLVTALLWAARRRLGVWLHSTLSQRRASVVEVIVRVTAAALIAVGVAGLFAPDRALPPIASALLLGGGAVTGAVGPVGTPHSGAGRGPSRISVTRLSLIATALLAAFWAESVYARQAGERFAEYTARTPSSRPAAVVYSKDQLQIFGPGVQVVRLGGTAPAYRFRYAGLRLLIFANARWILVPEGWTRSNGAIIIVLPDSSTLRVDFQPPLR